MKWNWDFLRNKKTEIDNRFLRASKEGKLISVNGHVHQIQGSHLSDMEVAGQVRMLMRDRPNHESICTLARDRIVYLADRLGEASDQIRALEEPQEGAPAQQPAPCPSTPAMKAAVELEVRSALGFATTLVIGQTIQKAIDAAIEECAKVADRWKYGDEAAKEIRRLSPVSSTDRGGK